MEFVVGTNQVKKALKKGEVKEVFLALNTDEKMLNNLINMCKAHDVKINYLETKKELGEDFGIGINAAIAAILI